MERTLGCRKCDHLGFSKHRFRNMVVMNVLNLQLPPQLDAMMHARLWPLLQQLCCPLHHQAPPLLQGPEPLLPPHLLRLALCSPPPHHGPHGEQLQPALPCTAAPMQRTQLRGGALLALLLPLPVRQQMLAQLLPLGPARPPALTML